MQSLGVFAHAFGQKYTLPIPLWIFLFTASAVIILSFLILAILMDEEVYTKKKTKAKEYRLNYVMPITQFIGVVILLIAIGADFFNEGILGFDVVFFWVVLLLGCTYLIAIFGNLWELFNPLKTIVEYVEKFKRSDIKPLLHYPDWLSYYPALITYFGIIWLELISGGFAVEPARLSKLILAYSLATLLYIICFGKTAWFKYGEFFSVFFGLVSKISPVYIKDNRLSFRRPLSGLLNHEATHFSLVLFILFMLSSTGFDGFRDTIAYRQLTSWLPDFLTNHYKIYQTIFLAITPFILLAFYLFFLRTMKQITKTNFTTMELAKKFAFSLIPIAVGYNLAHYFSLLILQIPYILTYSLDPFQLGWNLFGTSNFGLSVKPLSASLIWYVQITLIVIAHMVAVYVAHLIALRTFKNRKQAILSQYPILVLMVLYTVGSLGIIGLALTV